MIGSIKKIFSSVLSFLFGLLGGRKSEQKLPASNPKGRKKNGYFLELDEGETNQTANGNQPAKVEPAKTTELVSAAKSATEPAKTSKATANKPEPAKASEAKANKPEPAKTTANANKQPEPAKTTANANKPEPVKVELVQTAEGVKAEPAKQPAKTTAAANNQTETTFAPKYLAPTSTNGRRRPGPNMNTFLDMARQVKTPG